MKLRVHLLCMTAAAALLQTAYGQQGEAGPYKEATWSTTPNVMPVYPLKSLLAKEEGKVMLKVVVTAEGLPELVEISRSSGYYELDNSAVKAVKQWKFIPAKRDGHPVAVTVQVPIMFSLKDTPSGLTPEQIKALADSNSKPPVQPQ